MKREGISRARALLRTLTAALLLAGPGVVLATTTSGEVTPHYPPKDLKLVDGHWTPWDPPEPPEGAEVYVIVKGDNLWNLAQRDLGDPYLWPQIWDLNRYILDSHWIYPGDPLLLPGPVTVVAEETTPPDVDAEGDGAEGEGDGTGSEDAWNEYLDTAMAPPADPSGRPRTGIWNKPNPDNAAEWSEMICSGYILAERWESDTWVYAAEEEHQNAFGPGDIVYINQGLSSGVRPGDKFYAVHQEEKVVHPVYDRRVGWVVRKKSILQVIAAQAETATAEIIDGCSEIYRGYNLIRYTEPTSPKRRETDLEQYGVEDNGAVSGHVIHGDDSLMAWGEGDIVYLDLGMADGVEKGDYLMIYRENVTGEKRNEGGYKNWRWKHKSAVHAMNTRGIPRGMEIPRKMLGEVIILETNHHTATAKVMSSIREIYAGDEVQLMD